MLTMRLTEVALWTRGRVYGADVAVHGVGIDSRTLAGGELFVALAGSRSDGHAHLDDAAAHGAAAALVARRVDAALPQVVVADTEAALGDLASAARAASHAKVVGITGSNGKTTVKMLTAAILGRHGRTHATRGNFNNEIGLPLAVLALPADAEYAVFEMGAGKPGDIAALAAIARPQIGLVNNVAPAHLERMHSLEGIAETKGALYQALPADGVAVINRDDPFAGYFTQLAGRRRCLGFGLAADADVRAERVQSDADGSRFELVAGAARAAVRMPLTGRHNVANALAAAAIAVALEVPLATIAAGLAAAHAVSGRLEIHAMPGAWRIIDDSYNANPASLGAAIEAVTGMDGEAWLVLGDMAELGPDAAARHAECGALARARGVARLWALGPLSAAAVESFGPGGRHFADVQALTQALTAELQAGVNCLVKGSRSAHMERVVEALRAHPDWGDRHAA